MVRLRRALSALVLLLMVLSAVTPFTGAAPDDGSRTITKHGGESVLKVKPADRITGSTKSGAKTTYTGPGVTVEVDDQPGSFEYTWILSSKPSANTFRLTLTFTGCTYYYQPPLTAETWPKGYTVTETQVKDATGKVVASRPENVVGSYAVYSDKANGLYGTGKVAHIYRPLVTDAKGLMVWGVMSISGNVLTVTVDQAWLSKASYPVRVDPTFGYTSIGASSETMGDDYFFGGLATGVGGTGARTAHRSPSERRGG